MDQVVLALRPDFFRQWVAGTKLCIVRVDEAQQQVVVPTGRYAYSSALDDCGRTLLGILELELWSGKLWLIPFGNFKVKGPAE